MYVGTISMADTTDKARNIERGGIEKEETNKLESTFSTVAVAAVS